MRQFSGVSLQIGQIWLHEFVRCIHEKINYKCIYGIYGMYGIFDELFN